MLRFGGDDGDKVSETSMSDASSTSRLSPCSCDGVGECRPFWFRSGLPWSLLDLERFNTGLSFDGEWFCESRSLSLSTWSSSSFSFRNLFSKLKYSPISNGSFINYLWLKNYLSKFLTKLSYDAEHVSHKFGRCIIAFGIPEFLLLSSIWFCRCCAWISEPIRALVCARRWWFICINCMWFKCIADGL